MSLLIFPLTPLPTEIERYKDWNESVERYDSGERQAASPYLKPLYHYTVNIKLMTEVKQSSLWYFIDSVKGMTSPFLMKDPYDLYVNSVMGVRSGITNAATLFLYDTRSYMVRADTVTVGSLFSVLSGYVRNGVEYSYDQDSGVLTVNTKAITDIWGVRSMQYWKKVAFENQYKEVSKLWNLFSVSGMQLSELP